MKPTMAAIILGTCPPRPACFDNDVQWREWLVSAHSAGTRVTRRIEVQQGSAARYTFQRALAADDIDYCADCTVKRQQKMLDADRCAPPKRAASTPPLARALSTPTKGHQDGHCRSAEKQA